jgi:hypothetical protein
MNVILGGLLGDLGDLPGDLGVLPGDLGVLPGDLGVLPGDLGVLPGDLGVLPGDLGVLLFAENIPPRLARFVRLKYFTIVLYMHIANIKIHCSALGSLYSRAWKVHLLDERLDYFFVRIVIAFNILIQLFAYVLIFNVHLFFGFPARVRIHPLLNDARLIAGRHVYEFFHV